MASNREIDANIVCGMEADAVVVDIEGTAAPLAFVRMELMGWVAEHLGGWVEAHPDHEAVGEAGRAWGEQVGGKRGEEKKRREGEEKRKEKRREQRRREEKRNRGEQRRREEKRKE